MSFEEFGFLGNKAKEFPIENRSEYPELFGFVDEVNETLHRVKNLLTPNGLDPVHLVTACLYLRVVNSFAATVTLAELGMTIDAEVTARSLLEAVFYLGACVNDRSFAVTYIQSSEADRHGMMRKIVNKAERFSDFPIPLEEVKAMKAEIEQSNEAAGIKLLKVEDCAKLAKLELIYDYVYSRFSNSVHATPLSLKKFLVLSEQAPEEVEALFCGAWRNDIPQVLNATITSTCVAIVFICDVFKIDVATAQELYDRWVAFSKTLSPSHDTAPNCVK